MKVNWERLAKQLWADREVCGAIPPEISKERWEQLLARHTHRTEEDFPKYAWHFIKGPGDHGWYIAYFSSVRGIASAFTLKGFKLDIQHLNKHRDKLEIGPRIEPPEES